MIRAARIPVFGLLSATILCSQTLQIPASHTDRKTPGTFTVMMDTPEAKAPAALQWEFLIPPAIAVKSADIQIGKAAAAAQKNLACAAAKTPALEGWVRYACILAGGQSPIGNGPIAEVRYRAQADVGGVPVRVLIENIVGASPKLQRLAIPAVAGIITIL